MKAIIICGLCHKPKKYGESYALNVHDYSGADMLKRKVRACRPCTRKMGYKVKAGVSPFKKKYDKTAKK